MTKIDPASGRNTPIAKADAAKRTKAVDGVAQSGQRQGSGEPPPHLRRLFARVEETGEALAGDPGGVLLEEYRHSVRELLDATFREGVRVSQQAGFGLGQQAFAVVTKIDIALTELTDELLRRHVDRLRTGRYVNQIKGLIVDLFR